MYTKHHPEIIESINSGSIKQIQESIEAECRDCEIAEGTVLYNIAREKYLALIFFLKEEYNIDHFQPQIDNTNKTGGRECLLFG